MNANEQIADAYRRMADEALYRPGAPSDGMGNITVPEEELDMADEIRRFTQSFLRQEKEGMFDLGHPNHDGNGALALATEGARLICGVSYEHAARVLRIAAEECERIAAERD